MGGRFRGVPDVGLHILTHAWNEPDIRGALAVITKALAPAGAQKRC
jgi:hypothetical protein